MKKYIYQKFLLMCDYDSIDIDDYEIYHENIALVLPYTMKKCLLDYNTEFVRKINVEDIDNMVDTEEDWETFLDSIKNVDRLVLVLNKCQFDNPIIQDYRIATIKSYLFRLKQSQINVTIFKY